MKSQKVDYAWLTASILSFFILSISFILMSIEGESTTEGIPLVTLISGGIFWFSFICGIITQAILLHRVRAWLSHNRVRISRNTVKIGGISFFQNPFAIVSDVFMFIGLIGLIISVILTHGIGFSCYIFLALSVFSFSMHCILNGKTFYVIRNKSKIKQSLKKEDQK